MRDISVSRKRRVVGAGAVLTAMLALGAIGLVQASQASARTGGYRVGQVTTNGAYPNQSLANQLCNVNYPLDQPLSAKYVRTIYDQAGSPTGSVWDCIKG